MKKSKEVKPINSPDIKVDWSDAKKVLEYYSSFDRWSFYISGGCEHENACVEIKDGLALFDNIYYLPSGGSYEDWCSKAKEFPKDGWYYVYLYKKGYGYYSTMPTENYAYVYQLHGNKTPFTKAEVDEITRRNSYKFSGSYPNPSKEDIEHILSIDLRHINSQELSFIQANLAALYESILPFKASNGVIINKWNGFKNSLSTQKGLIYMDNSYPGPFINKMDYGLILKFHPSYSNEAKYYSQVYINDLSTTGLERLAIEIEKSLKSFAKL